MLEILATFGAIGRWQGSADDSVPYSISVVSDYGAFVESSNVKMSCATLSSDPKDKKESFGWVKKQCTPALYPSAPGEYMKDVLAEMERLNVTAVVSGRASVMMSIPRLQGESASA
jgi:hypothetical protein